jgi:hypothetical protein
LGVYEAFEAYDPSRSERVNVPVAVQKVGCVDGGRQRRLVASRQSKMTAPIVIFLYCVGVCPVRKVTEFELISISSSEKVDRLPYGRPSERY